LQKIKSEAFLLHFDRPQIWVFVERTLSKMGYGRIVLNHMPLYKYCCAHHQKNNFKSWKSRSKKSYNLFSYYITIITYYSLSSSSELLENYIKILQYKYSNFILAFECLACLRSHIDDAIHHTTFDRYCHFQLKEALQLVI